MAGSIARPIVSSPSLKRSSCRDSLKGFLDGKDVEPQIDKQVMGGIIRIEVYHNADAALAYAQYFTGNSYLAQMEGGLANVSFEPGCATTGISTTNKYRF